MNLADAYSRRQAALRHMQYIARPLGNFTEEQRLEKVAEARARYQAADQAYRKIAKAES